MSEASSSGVSSVSPRQPVRKTRVAHSGPRPVDVHKRRIRSHHPSSDHQRIRMDERIGSRRLKVAFFQGTRCHFDNVGGPNQTAFELLDVNQAASMTLKRPVVSVLPWDLAEERRALIMED